MNPSHLGGDYLAVVLVRAKYGPGYHEKVGRKLAKLPGVWSVYYVLGDIDFVILVWSANRAEYMQKLEMLTGMRDIERTSTLAVAKTMKEEPRVEIT